VPVVGPTVVGLAWRPLRRTTKARVRLKNSSTMLAARREYSRIEKSSNLRGILVFGVCLATSIRSIFVVTGGGEAGGIY